MGFEGRGGTIASITTAQIRACSTVTCLRVLNSCIVYKLYDCFCLLNKWWLFVKHLSSGDLLVETIENGL
jgi:hypothetical protein